MPSSGIQTCCYRQWELWQVLEHRSEFLSGPVLSQVQTRSADEPMTTFVLCNECGNRWKVCMSVTFSLPRHPRLLPPIRSRIPTTEEGGLPAYADGACRAGAGGGWLLGRRGEGACACFCFGRHPALAGGHGHQTLPCHLPFIRQLWKSPTLPKTVIWAVPAPAKAEVLFSGVGAKQRLLGKQSSS